MRRAVLLPGAAAAALLATAAAAQAPRTITFCAATDNLPLSHRDAGVEVELARRLAESLGATARFEWLEHGERPGEALPAGRCDAALGAVVDPGTLADGRRAPGIALTTPYYGAGYALIRRADVAPVRTLAELGDTRIAVETESIPIYTLKQRGNRVYAVHDYDAVVEAVADGRADYGYLWGPLASWLLRDRSDVVLAPEFEPVERWSFSLALRESDGALRERLDAAIRDMVRSGEAARVFGEKGVPYLPPGER
ncbi:MAG TPA: transporter substrate-binding domain-containing protein [Longimicrobiaceae bacterium]|nr:transporter substrate-binding domain-containing protein [Longimicrobiaceae bacterium]